jgi:Cu-Zn family superoxide dismutase
MHMGDLPNLIVGTDGSGRLEATISGATIDGSATPLLDADGAAIVIHAGADDYRTDPSGNSGARVACGLFTAG